MPKFTTKDLAFRAAAIALPLLIILAVELAMRAAGVASAEREPFTQYDAAGTHLVLNTAYVSRYFKDFRPGVAETPFRPTKEPGTLRVFVLGGSSAAGFPYQSRHSFGGRLQERLSAAFFPRSVEVVNLGLTAVNSFTVLDLGRAALQQDADLLVVYSGHNEYYGAMGVATTQGALGGRAVLKLLLIRLRRTALFSLLERALRGDAPADQGESRTLMARVIGERDVTRGSKSWRAGIDQFADNISRLLKAADRHDVPVIMGTLVSNLSGQRPLSADSSAAAAFEEGGRLLEGGATGAAREAFVRARALDGTRFRAPDEINDWIRREVPAAGVEVVDIERLFRSVGKDGIEGADLFTDHLHPNARGHHLMAGAFARSILERHASEKTRGIQVSSDSSLDALEAAHSKLSLDRLLGDYPFVRDVDPEETSNRFEAILAQARQSGGVDSIAAALVSGRTDWLKAQRSTAELLLARRDTLAALRAARAMAMMRPLGAPTLGQWLTLAAGVSGNLSEEAIRLGIATARSGDALPVSALGAVLLREGRLREARLALDEAETRDPDDAVILFNLARLLVLDGDTLGARTYFDRYRANR